MQYLILIQKNNEREISTRAWEAFFELASQSGMFRGGSAISDRQCIGKETSHDSGAYLGGFMRFDADDYAALQELLEKHPVVTHGGSIEIFEMPKT